jgi:hypothetical protein
MAGSTKSLTTTLFRFIGLVILALTTLATIPPE